MIDRGRGIPVVFIPGIQGRWEWMAPAIDALASRCRVLTFSLCDEPTSGFECDPRRGFTSYLDQIDQAMTRAGVERAVILGLSFGGLIATEFAARYPERVNGLILASALPVGWQLDPRVRFYLRAPRVLSPLFVAASPFRMFPEIRRAFPTVATRLRFSVASAMRVFRAFLSPARMARRIEWMQRHQFADPRLVSTPALVITGEDDLDRVVAPPLTRRYLAMLPSAQAVVLRDTGHLGFLTRPELFADTVMQFADQVWSNARRVSA